ncbi:fasciclin domain-containing protein [Cylindrospermopsis raciborskii]|uniref:Fasciclin n=1 Tax=Cylindrospermopsis raciborskii CENA302 TaxID=1170768 RepID=A0A9Q5QWB3_9CYAN|nr:fasciclin domain-containing protein [Cylindrospermopsis raciborskii]MCZ2200381.1 fasciclin domain-containing protein [Cylindrospermopsis raciborskii PAMP2012]MCZ2206763.1 fasciclin domain-containing protein [Cylindrospermopsis raciborskii PAMP2011]NLQ06271.1 fasciclin domain-containing protein [Cylindrospermopsis raciborskii MVCC19]OHY35493.1 fasciclin [Cylindrospermopsis raciborskii MVCC14]OPH09375.1 fasciclin [Cylindrospermopsis raciborskii CENA302]
MKFKLRANLTNSWRFGQVKVFTGFLGILALTSISLGVDLPSLGSKVEIVQSNPTITTPPTPELPIFIPEDTEAKNLIEVAKSTGNFKTLIRALEAGGLIKTLEEGEQFTIFAPTDEAFAKVPKRELRNLFRPKNKQVLVDILKYHVVVGRIGSEELKTGPIKSLQGEPIQVRTKSKSVYVSDGQSKGTSAKITKPDISASNGVIHQIDSLLLPPSLK